MAFQIVTSKPAQGMTLPEQAARFFLSLTPAQRRAFMAGFALSLVFSQPGQPAQIKPL